MNKYLGIFIVVILMSINPFLKRLAMKNITPSEYMTFHGIIICVTMILFVVFLIHSKKFKLDFYKRMTHSQIIFTIVSAIFTLTNAMLLVTLLKEYSPTDITPFIDPMVILLVGCIGYFYFKTSFNIQKIIGYMVIVVGLLTLSFDIKKAKKMIA